MDVILQVLARAKLPQRMARLLNCSIPFQVALHADGIPPGRGELGRIDDRSVVLRMVCAWAVTPFATYAFLRNQRFSIFVFRTRKRSLRMAGVAIQAGSSQGQFSGICFDP